MVVEVLLLNRHDCRVHLSVHPSLLLFQDHHYWPTLIYLVFWLHVFSHVPPLYDDRYVMHACLGIAEGLFSHPCFLFNRLCGVRGVLAVHSENLLHY